VIRLEFVYVLTGLLAAGVAAVNALDAAHPRRWANATFWGLWAVTFLFGSYMADAATGALVIAMAIVASTRGIRAGRDTTTPDARTASAARWGNKLFIPALLIPVLALLGTLTLRDVHVGDAALVDPKQVTLVSLALATIVALTVAMLMLRPGLTTPVREARRLLDQIGWAAVLPQMLAALGAVFAAAGVGKAVSTLAVEWLPLGQPVMAVVAYTVGMWLFTIIMGNAFAAFPVMTAGIGLPLIVTKYHGDPVVMCALGMVSGYCGTLMTPMAANYNIVPAALLELPDQYGVIRVQVPTGLALLAVNTIVMAAFVYR
jgi:uncharacterized membrane protein